ncbi:MAG: glutamate--tRNA ligase [Candidatus Microgenomates bacterium]
MTIRTRIAPSPTGIAHLGTAYIAMRNLALARQSGGQFLIRIEDTDRERYVEGAVEVIFEAMKWLGYTYDEAPDIGGPHAPYTQSERLPIYLEYALELIKKGRAYYCFCSKDRLEQVRESQLASKQLPRYDGHCRNLTTAEVEANLAANLPHVIRLAVPKEGTTICHDPIRGEVSFENSGIDDQVLIKSDGYPTYHLAVVIDDHLMEITHVVRGEEWLSSTPKHLLLYEAFGWQAPIFAHLPVIRNKDKSKMSKRKNDVSILSHRDRGYLPEALNNFMALMGWSHPEGKELFSLEEFLRVFSLDRVTKTAPIYDTDKLNYYNGYYIRSLSDTDLINRLKAGFIPGDCPPDLIPRVLPLVKERMVTLKDFESLTSFFYRKPEKISHSSEEKEYLATASNVLNKCEWSKDGIETALVESVKARGWKNGPFFAAMRLAITGKKISPPLTESMLILGREAVLERLK